MKYIQVLFEVCSALFLLVVFVYLIFPSPKFPTPPSDSVQSLEKADTETSLRRSYFTNFTRKEILAHYQSEFSKSLPIPVPSYIVYYPPEDAQTLIRDQTRSVQLPEVIHPFRESLFVNMFEARSPKDAISYRGVAYNRKITVRYVPSSGFLRVSIALLSSLLFVYLVKELFLTCARLASKP